MSRLAISANRPFLAVARTVASTNPSLVRLLSTTSTPAPSVSARIWSAKSVVRESYTCFTPSLRSVARLKVLAVA